MLRVTTLPVVLSALVGMSVGTNLDTMKKLKRSKCLNHDGPDLLALGPVCSPLVLEQVTWISCYILCETRS